MSGAGRDIGLRLPVAIHVLATGVSGRWQPLPDGMRPLCRFPTDDREPAFIGLCELRLERPLPPGRDGHDTLLFDRRVCDLVSARLARDPSFELLEGLTVVARARADGPEVG